MEFDRVCREWRCKYTGDKATSESLEEISKVVDEYLPTIKGISDGVKVNRLVCGSCLDFKLMITVPLLRISVAGRSPAMLPRLSSLRSSSPSMVFRRWRLRPLPTLRFNIFPEK